MATQKVTKEIKAFLRGQGWNHIANVLKEKRSTYAAQILCLKQIDDKIYTEADLIKERIRMMNSILDIPKIMVEVEEEVSDEDIAKDTDNLDIGSVDELFVTKE